MFKLTCFTASMWLGTILHSQTTVLPTSTLTQVSPPSPFSSKMYSSFSSGHEPSSTYLTLDTSKGRLVVERFRTDSSFLSGVFSLTEAALCKGYRNLFSVGWVPFGGAVLCFLLIEKSWPGKDGWNKLKKITIACFLAFTKLLCVFRRRSQLSYKNLQRPLLPWTNSCFSRASRESVLEADAGLDNKMFIELFLSEEGWAACLKNARVWEAWYGVGLTTCVCSRCCSKWVSCGFVAVTAW